MYMGANKITFIDLLCIELCATSKVSVEGCLVMTASPAAMVVSQSRKGTVNTASLLAVWKTIATARNHALYSALGVGLKC